MEIGTISPDSMCVRGASLGVFSAGRISLTLTGYSVCVGGSVDCSGWPRADCAVDFSPGESGWAL